MSGLVTLPGCIQEASLAHLELGSELTRVRLPLIGPQPRAGELSIELPDSALVDRAVRLAIVQPLEAAGELSLQALALCSKTLARESLVLQAVH